MIKQLEKLRNEIRMHDQHYAIGKPIITDTEYDAIYRQLVHLEQDQPELITKDSPTQTITPIVVDEIHKSSHRQPMLSLRDVNTFDGIQSFIQDKNEILIQDKMDGITIVLTYDDGKLVKAVTRGDGFTGDDLTHNIQQIDNVPKTIDFKGPLEVRGEIILPYKDFERLNVNGDYSNPRNTVAGAVRRHDSNNIVGVGYKVIVFNLEYIENQSFESDYDAIQYLDELGFEIVTTKLFSLDNDKALEDLKTFIDHYETVVRPNLPFMIDGLVLKVNNLHDRESLGSTSKFPRWSLAYKFKSLDATTTLNEVIHQVGKSGQITPVAVFDEIVIDDVKITRATLSNYQIIKAKDIRIHDQIVVERANDVIPQVVKALDEIRTGIEEPIKPPTHCPSCGSKTVLDGAHLYCRGLTCKPQLEGKLAHFASRDAMDIDGLGEKTVTTLYQAGIITTILDIYKLTDKQDEILQLERFGEKSYQRLLKGVEQSKSKEFRNVLYGLHIENVGRSATRDLAIEFESLTAIIDASKDPASFKERLLNIPSFGEVLSSNVVDFFAIQDNIDLMNELIQLGLPTTLNVTANSVADSAIKDLTFVITGKVTHYKSRKELKSHIEELGGKVTGSVSKNTDYLINNDAESQTSKNKQAIERNIPIISEHEFLDLLK